MSPGVKIEAGFELMQENGQMGAATAEETFYAVNNWILNSKTFNYVALSASVLLSFTNN